MSDPTATLKTNRGDIKITLLPNHAPKTVRNFEDLINKGFYDGLTFHRVIDGFMIQGGCPEGTGTGGPGYTFDDEIHPELSFNEPYLLAMANAGKKYDGSGTNGSQFFITVSPTTWLTGKHTIFGKVEDADSKAVVDAIAITQTGAADRPVEPVVIESVELTGA